jgi:hypothetical protein
MNIASRTAVTLVTAALVALSVPSGPSHAAGHSPGHPPAALLGPPGVSASRPGTFSLAISPTRLVLGPGDLGTTQTIQVFNGGTAPMPVVVQKQNFTSNRTGALLFQKLAPYSASSWVTVRPSRFVVPAGGSTTVRATVAIPSRPEPGDHQLALTFLVPAGQTTANVRINRGIGMPVFITVPGATDDTASVTALHADGFSTGGSVDVTATIQDTGTVHRDFRDQTPLLLRRGGSSQAFPDFTVMRGGIRDISTPWNAPLMCICHLTVSVTNAHGVVQSRTVRVIVFPLVQVLVGLLGLVILAGLYRLARRRYRANVVRAAAVLGHHMGTADD